jgi:hypothetical protein
LWETPVTPLLTSRLAQEPETVQRLTLIQKLAKEPLLEPALELALELALRLALELALKLGTQFGERVEKAFEIEAGSMLKAEVGTMQHLYCSSFQTWETVSVWVAQQLQAVAQEASVVPARAQARARAQVWAQVWVQVQVQIEVQEEVEVELP